MEECEGRKADLRRVMRVSDRKSASAFQYGGRIRRRPVAEFNVGYDNLRYEVGGIRIFRVKMGKPSGCADPDRTIGRSQERIGVAILPDQTLGTAIVSPLSVDQSVSTSVRSHPNRSVRSTADEICLIGVESIALSKVLGMQRFSLRFNSRNALGKGIGDPDRAIGSLGDAEN